MSAAFVPAGRKAVPLPPLRGAMDRPVAAADAHAPLQLRGDVLWDNLPMLALARRLGAQLHAEPGMAGVLQLRLALAGPGGDAPIRPWSGPAFRPAAPAAPER